MGIVLVEARRTSQPKARWRAFSPEVVRQMVKYDVTDQKRSGKKKQQTKSYWISYGVVYHSGGINEAFRCTFEASKSETQYVLKVSSAEKPNKVHKNESLFFPVSVSFRRQISNEKCQKLRWNLIHYKFDCIALSL